MYEQPVRPFVGHCPDKEGLMSNTELELMSVIQKSEDPVEAIFTAIKIFSSFLKQCEADQLRQTVCLPESV